MLPGHESSLMNSIEREDWMAARFDHLRRGENEDMCKYIAHLREMDPSIVRHESSKKKRAREADEGQV
jgi:hypothetical protein